MGQVLPKLAEVFPLFQFNVGAVLQISHDNILAHTFQRIIQK